jgi:hypothetical protein
MPSLAGSSDHRQRLKFGVGKHPIKRFCPERARDGVGEIPFECYRKWIGHFLGRRYNLPLANNAHRHKVERWRPYRNMFFESVTYNNDLAPFQGASAGWAVPRVETLG